MVNEKSRVYLDASVITVWILTEDEPGKIARLPPNARNCMCLLDSIVRAQLNCKFQTSDWAFSEMVQGLRDRIIAHKFMLDGYEISSFNRLKSQYPLEQAEISVVQQSLNDFTEYLTELSIEFLKLSIDWREIHEYWLKYSLETPDATHLLIAAKHSDYLTTIDRQLKQTPVTEVTVLDPGDLLTRKELRL